MLLEACVETLEEAIIAEKKGAHRLELCSRLDLDGLSPGEELSRSVIAAVSIPVKIMIRPRGGDFQYNTSEISLMAKEIEQAQKWGVEGVVLGLLDKNREIDLKNTAKLASLAGPLHLTFHKAIDETPDLLQSLRVLQNIPGINAILTSGGATTALQGQATLRQMLRQAPPHLRIIPAGRITQDNIHDIHNLLGASEYHGRRIVGALNGLP